MIETSSGCITQRWRPTGCIAQRSPTVARSPNVGVQLPRGKRWAFESGSRSRSRTYLQTPCPAFTSYGQQHCAPPPLLQPLVGTDPTVLIPWLRPTERCFPLSGRSSADTPNSDSSCDWLPNAELCSSVAAPTVTGGTALLHIERNLAAIGQALPLEMPDFGCRMSTFAALGCPEHQLAAD